MNRIITDCIRHCPMQPKCNTQFPKLFMSGIYTYAYTHAHKHIYIFLSMHVTFTSIRVCILRRSRDWTHFNMVH